MKKRFICQYCKKTKECFDYKPKEVLYLNGCDNFESKIYLDLSNLNNDKEIVLDENGVYTVY